MIFDVPSGVDFIGYDPAVQGEIFFNLIFKTHHGSAGAAHEKPVAQHLHVKRVTVGAFHTFFQAVHIHSVIPVSVQNFVEAG
ncbi:hypothetical protein SAMN05216235_0287 [Salinicoccus halodurans]|uniref:Uncharacterized protein n=1 Tax=Salinicoccus halodurans TaxID=407035 RepID=A0AA94HC06_9STAP|nr:hypothetical protein SAMN05216235_0287 [Salinicoccus halodurans]